MKVLLLQDVYKLGRAGDVKKVANGYGRNYLIPQGLAIPATQGALKRAEKIREEANKKRAVLNQEMSGVAEQLANLVLTFPARASETGRLYGSINNRLIAETLSEKIGVEISHRQIDSQPLRMIGEHTINIRLTVDLVPVVKVIVYREGETLDSVLAAAEATSEGEAAEEVNADTQEESKDEAKAEDEEQVEDTVADARSAGVDQAEDAEA